jgi:hypothetical protein
MKRLALLVFVVLAIPAAAAAAISGTGGGTSIANGQATLVSNSTSPYSWVSFDDLAGQPVGNLSELSADVLSATWGGGSPRFAIDVTNGSDTKSIVVYLGDLPNYTTGTTGQTGNLLDSGARVDSTQLGGPYYGTWADAVSAAAASGYSTIADIAFIVDGGWATGGSQTVVIDGVSINGTTHGFAATSKADCKDGGWQALGYRNQGDCVSSVASGS